MLRTHTTPNTKHKTLNALYGALKRESNSHLERPYPPQTRTLPYGETLLAPHLATCLPGLLEVESWTPPPLFLSSPLSSRFPPEPCVPLHLNCQSQKSYEGRQLWHARSLDWNQGDSIHYSDQSMKSLKRRQHLATWMQLMQMLVVEQQLQWISSYSLMLLCFLPSSFVQTSLLLVVDASHAPPIFYLRHVARRQRCHEDHRTETDSLGGQCHHSHRDVQRLE